MQSKTWLPSFHSMFKFVGSQITPICSNVLTVIFCPFDWFVAQVVSFCRGSRQQKLYIRQKYSDDACFCLNMGDHEGRGGICVIGFSCSITKCSSVLRFNMRFNFKMIWWSLQDSRLLGETVMIWGLKKTALYPQIPMT